jgi:hypothetical protein
LVIVTITLFIIQKRFVVSDNTYENSVLLAYKIDKTRYLVSCLDNRINIYLENRKIFSQYELKNEIILSSAISDLDNDGKDEIILLTSKEAVQYGDDLVVLSYKNYKATNVGKDNIIFKEIYRNHCKDLNPWKVQTSDVDGDGKTEISIGVYKTSPLHQVMAKRPFIYDWVNGGIFPKWRGSRLSRPFDDYIFLDLDSDGRDEIVSIEHTPNDERILTSYSWKGFGFEKTGESQSFEDISSLQVELYKGEKTNIITTKVKKGKNWSKKKFYYLEGKIIDLMKK